MSDALHEVGKALYGERWQSELARALGISLRTVQRWAAGDGAPHRGHWDEIAMLLASRKGDVEVAWRTAIHQSHEADPAR